MNTSPETFLCPEVPKDEPDSGKPNWLRAFFGSLLQRFSVGQSRQRAIEAKKEKIVSEVEQINIEELCSLLPEEFLKSPQFFKSFELYNLLFYAENPIPVEKLQDDNFVRLVVDRILTMFINLRSLLTNDLQKAKSIDQFRNRVLKYLDEKDGQQEPEVRKECASLSADNPIGVPDTIRRFHKLDVVLQADGDAYGDWYVFVNGRRYIVNFSYGQELHRMDQGRMVLIEWAFGAHILDAENFIDILIKGQPYFDELIKSIINRRPKI